MTHVLLASASASASAPLCTKLPLDRAERRIKDLGSKSCYKTHMGAFLRASGRREERDNLHHLWRWFQKRNVRQWRGVGWWGGVMVGCGGWGCKCPFLKMAPQWAAAKCRSSSFVFRFQKRRSEQCLYSLHKPQPNKHSWMKGVLLLIFFSSFLKKLLVTEINSVSQLLDNQMAQQWQSVNCSSSGCDWSSSPDWSCRGWQRCAKSQQP